jgi:hypothetical protein
MAQYCVLNGGICNSCDRCRPIIKAFPCDYCNCSINVGEEYRSIDDGANVHIDCLDDYLHFKKIVQNKIIRRIIMKVKKIKESKHECNFKVTFENNNRCNPVSRTVEVKANDELHARDLVSSQYGSNTYNKKLFMFIPSTKHIKITNVTKL